MIMPGEIVTGTQNGTQLLLKGLGYHSKDTFRLAQKMTIKMTTFCSTLVYNTIEADLLGYLLSTMTIINQFGSLSKALARKL